MSLLKVEMYVTRTCAYCSRAKGLLKSKGVSWIEHDVTGNERLIEEMVQRAGGQTTVPQIFVDEHHIGGYDDLAALDSKGQLDDILQR